MAVILMDSRVNENTLTLHPLLKQFSPANRPAEQQIKRRALLAKRDKPRANTAEIELHLAIVRAELQALYQGRRQRD